MAELTRDRILQLRQQGYTNAQLVDILQRDGFTSEQVFSAINEADLPSAAPASLPTGAPPPPPLPPVQSPAETATTAPAPSPTPTLPPPMPLPEASALPPPSPDPLPKPHHASHVQSGGAAAPVSTEEYVEAIIDEKWTDLEDDIRRVVEWKNRSEQRIQLLAQQVDDLKGRFEKLHAALIGKIENYDQNILEVGAEIKAMEKVFSKVLPVFTDNVKQLSDVTERLDKRTR